MPPNLTTSQRNRPFTLQHSEQKRHDVRERDRAGEDIGHLPARLLLVATVLMSGVWQLPDFDPQGESSLAKLLWGLLYLLGVAGLIVERRAALRLLRASVPLVLIVLVAGLSTIWSEEPWASARRSLGLLGSSALTLYLVCRLGLRRYIETLGFAIAITAAISVVLVAFFPTIGLMQDEYARAWRGFFYHKNLLGMAMTFGMMTMACAMDGPRGIRRAYEVAAFFMCLVLLIGSLSTTSAIVASTLLLLFPLLLSSRKLRSSKLALLTALALSAAFLGAIVFGFSADDALNALGKDATLTGRTGLWQVVLDAIAERPALGFGYEAYFNPNTLTAQAVERSVNWDVPNAHNGFLEVTLGLGLLGLAVVIRALAVGTLQTWALFWQGRDRASAWPFLTVILMLLDNLTENSLAAANDVLWMSFVAAYLFATSAQLRTGAKELEGSPARNTSVQS